MGSSLKADIKNTAHAPVRPAPLRHPPRTTARAWQEAARALTIQFPVFWMRRRSLFRLWRFRGCRISGTLAFDFPRAGKLPTHGLASAGGCFGYFRVSGVRFWVFGLKSGYVVFRLLTDRQTQERRRARCLLVFFLLLVYPASKTHNNRCFATPKRWPRCTKEAPPLQFWLRQGPREKPPSSLWVV